MVTRVNPPPVPNIPASLVNDPELRGFFLEWQRILYQLWERTGGYNDEVSNLATRELYPWDANNGDSVPLDLIVQETAETQSAYNYQEENEPEPMGRVLSSNSTSTLLNNGQTFSGDYVDVSEYDSLIVAAKTDQDGVIKVIFSPDGVNADSTLSTNYKTSRINPPRRYTITRKYAKIEFENNSGSNQTYLRLQTTVGQKSPLNAPLDGTLSQNFDSLPVRPVDYYVDTALGRREGHVVWNKWGYNADIDTASSETIWPAGGLLVPATSAETLDVVSTNAADDSGSTGLEQIRIIGIGANYEYQTEDVTLDGLTTVTTTNTWLGINRVAPLSAGSGQVNAGDINITGNTSSNTFAQMPAGTGVTQQGFFYVPASRKFLANWLLINVNKISGGSSPRVTIKGWVWDLANMLKYQIYQETLDTGVENNIELSPVDPFVVSEKSLLEFTAETDTNNTVVNIRFSGVEIEDA